MNAMCQLDAGQKKEINALQRRFGAQVTQWE